ncbi:MAG: hypothetical protein JXQ73_24425 [Phycisphaerae bacterium]|nr:hypothetical protein [Phycisphaerae bacterium]
MLIVPRDRAARTAMALLTLAVCTFFNNSAALAAKTYYGDSYLETVGGLRVLHLKGASAEMGYAHGYLLAQEVKTVYDALGQAFRREMTEQEQAAIAADARPYIPARFIQEVQAIAAGANDALGTQAIDADRLLVLHSWDEIINQRMDRGATAHFAALGGGTADGDVIVGVDYVDETAIRRGVQNGAVLIVYEPPTGHTFAAVSWAGFAGAMVGINSQGLVISECRFPAQDQRMDGVPLPFQVRSALETCADVASTEALFKSTRRTVTANVLVADGVGQSAVRVFEFSKSGFQIFREGDPNEDHTYTVQARGTPLTINIEDLSFDLNMPEVGQDVQWVASKPLPNAIVRTGGFVHHTGATPLQSYQAKWAMGFVSTDPDFDFLDITGLPVQYPYPSLDLVYMIDTILAGRARELVPGYAGILDIVVPGWDLDLYHPDSAAPSRYAAMQALLEQRLGSLDEVGAAIILGKGVTPEWLDVLRDPNSLHAVVFNASTMEMWVAVAPPTGSSGKPDASYQTYWKCDFGAVATYPLEVKTTPVKGEVRVDGTSWGKAPVTKRVKPGQYIVSFQKVDGYISPPDQIVTVGIDGASITGTYQVARTLTVEVSGQGAVDPSGGDYVTGTKVTLKATPAKGWHFVKWSGSVSGSDTTVSLTMNADKKVVATFAENPPNTFTLATEVIGQGTVQPSNGFYDSGDAVTLTATPASGWQLMRWEGDASGTSLTTQVTFNTDKSVRAIFGTGPYRFDVSVVGQGSVDPPTGGYDLGDVVPIYATPADGWHFVRWSGDVAGLQPSTSITVEGDTAVTARFEANPAGKSSLTVHVEGPGAVDPGSGLHDTGDVVTLTAEPAQFSAFVRWTGAVESTDPTITFAMDKDKTVRAVFEQKLQCVLTVEIQGEGDVLLSPTGGAYPCGTEVTLEAVVQEASPVWEFLKWQGDVDSQENPLTITVQRDTKILAVFSQKSIPDNSPGCFAAPPAPMVAGLLLMGGYLMTGRIRRIR